MRIVSEREAREEAGRAGKGGCEGFWSSRQSTPVGITPALNAVSTFTLDESSWLAQPRANIAKCLNFKMWLILIFTIQNVASKDNVPVDSNSVDDSNNYIL